MNVVVLAALMFLQTSTQPPEDTKLPKSADYTIQIWVQSSRLIRECDTDTTGSTCYNSQLLSAVIDRRKYELHRSRVDNVLRPGEYKARLIADKKPRREEFSREFEILFSDGKTGRFSVVGESE